MTRSFPSPRSRSHVTRGGGQRQRKETRACDFCRGRKIKCNRDQESTSGGDPRCQRCKWLNIECTYKVDAKPRGYTMSFADYLEDRLEHIEHILAQLFPSLDVSSEVGPPVNPWAYDGQMSTRRKRLCTPGTNVGSGVPMSLRPAVSRANLASDGRVCATKPCLQMNSVDFTQWRGQQSQEDDDDSTVSSDNEYCHTAPPTLGLESDDWSPEVPRFHGKSSHFSLVAETRKLRITNTSDNHDNVESQSHNSQKIAPNPGKRSDRRHHYASQGLPLELTFPPDDLFETLIDLYFKHVNVIRPLLHRPTFQNDVTNQRHKYDPAFGCVALAVCAIASRYCKDPRVLAKVAKLENQQNSGIQSPPGPESWVDDNRAIGNAESFKDARWSSAGWKFYDRVERYQRSDSYPLPSLEPIKLTEIQVAYLMFEFLSGHSDYMRGWCMIGVAIRRAQDLGANIKKRYSYADRSVESELWRRGLWCLIEVDRTAGLYGRSGISYAEYFHLTLPLEVDDEHWTMADNGRNAVFLEQPAGKPSVISAFNAHLKLSVIYEFATSHLHAADESRIPNGFPAFDVVGHLEREMTGWLQAFPEHLRGDSTHDNRVWKIQSTILHIEYHLLRMHVYKRFALGGQPRNLFPASRLPGATILSSPTGRVCTAMPTPSNARSICTVSAHAIATLLRDLRSIVETEMPLSLQLLHTPSFIAGAACCGQFLHIVRIEKNKRSQQLSSIANDDSSPLGAIIDDDLGFDVCTHFLAALQDRWASAETIRRGMVAGSEYSRGSTPMTPGSDSCSCSSNCCSDREIRPSLHNVPQWSLATDYGSSELFKTQPQVLHDQLKEARLGHQGPWVSQGSHSGLTMSSPSLAHGIGQGFHRVPAQHTGRQAHETQNDHGDSYRPLYARASAHSPTEVPLSSYGSFYAEVVDVLTNDVSGLQVPPHKISQHHFISPSSHVQGSTYADVDGSYYW